MTDRTGRESYHHGDLRQALIAAALQLLDGEGEAGVTLRAASRMAGVSHSAPYHHFADRDALIDGLARQVARELGDELRASTSGSPDFGTSAQRIGVAYVRWAVEHPARFRLLSRHRSSSLLHEEDEAAEGAGIVEPDEPAEPVSGAWQGFGRGVLVESLVRGQAAGFIAEGDPRTLAMTAWSTMHGLATLLLDGLLTPGPPTVEDAERLARRTTATIGYGLLRR